MCPSPSAIAISARPITSRARASSLCQTETSSRMPLASWASRCARGGSCQRSGSLSSFWSASRRASFSATSKMLLELEDLFQQVVGALEDLVHDSVSVAVLESLAAAAGADVVAADAGKVEALRPPEWWAGGSSARRGGLGLAAARGRERGRWRRRGGLLDQLDTKDRGGDVELDAVEQFLERLESLVLVLDQGIFLAEGAQADALLEVLHLGEVADPLRVDGLEHDELLDLAHHRLGHLRFLGLVRRVGVLHQALDGRFLGLAELVRGELAEGWQGEDGAQLRDEALEGPVVGVAWFAVLLDGGFDRL